MARPRNQVCVREYRLWFFLPGLRIHHLTPRPRQLTQTIIFIPKSAGGIDDKQMAAVPKCFGPFVDLWKIALFPIAVRLRNANPLATNCPGIAHRSEVKILYAICALRPTRPEEIKFLAWHLEHCAIDGPSVRGRCHFAFKSKRRLRVIRAAFE